MQSIATMLRSVPGFAELDEAALEHVAAAGDLAEVEAGDVLFREGALPRVAIRSARWDRQPDRDGS